MTPDTPQPPAHPIDALVGHSLDPFFGLAWLDASRFDEAVRALCDEGFVACTPSARGPAAVALLAALRSDPTGVIVRAADLVTDEDVELLVRAALTGHVAIVCGTTPALEAALARDVQLPIFDRRRPRGR